MNEWQYLEVDNLLPDILTGGYEWEYLTEFNSIDLWASIRFVNVMEILEKALTRKYNYKYRYRKSECKQSTHGEILQRVKKELNIELDTKIADMKKSITWHMDYLYDSIIPPEAE